MSEETQNPAVIEDAATEQTAATAQAQLQIADILAAAQLIQLASSRGAFRAEEFTQIGGVYERLVAFLQQSGAIAPAGDAGTTEEASAN
jgi:hypothetical protein